MVCLWSYEIGDLYWRDRQHLSSAELPWGGVYEADQDRTAEADGGSGQRRRLGQDLPPVCHQLSLGAGLGLPQEVPEKDIHTAPGQVK